MTKSQRKATILGRLVGMAASIYFWFILNNYGRDYPEHQSIIVAFLEGEDMSALAVIGIMVLSTLILTMSAGFVARLLFSFRDEE